MPGIAPIRLERKGFHWEWTIPLWALALAFITSCGSGPSADQVSVTITPAAASVPVHGSVALQGNAAGFSVGPTVSWWIKESKDLDFNADCGLLETQQPPAEAVCPYGYVVFSGVSGIPSSAVYHAPGTAGTYRVVMDAAQLRGYGDPLSVDALATITVTP